LIEGRQAGRRSVVREKIDDFTGVPALSGSVAATRMAEQYVREIERMAYVWAWLMFNLHNLRVDFEQIPEPGLMGGVMPCGPPGRFEEGVEMEVLHGDRPTWLWQLVCTTWPLLLRQRIRTGGDT
jgi:hypothetical protein